MAPVAPDFDGSDRRAAEDGPLLANTSAYQAEINVYAAGGDAFEMRNVKMAPHTTQTELNRLSIEALEPSGSSKMASADPSKVRSAAKSIRTRLWQFPWLWEISACVVSITCFAGIVGVLLFHNGEPLDEWALLIPPNAVVSFLATIAKSSAVVALTAILSQRKWDYFRQQPRALEDFDLFDEASRGPLGSTVLLFTKHRHTALASSAALLLAGALLIDPFVQLCIRFPTKPFPGQPLSAELETRRVFHPLGIQLEETSTYGEAASLEASMKAAIALGVYGSNVNHQVRCRHDHCIFANVTNLGICNAYNSIEEEGRVDCASLKDGRDGVLCRYEMESGMDLTTFDTNIHTDFRGTFWNATTFVRSRPARFDWSPVDESATLVSFGAVHRTPIEGLSTYAYGGTRRIWQATFFWCGLTYDFINVTNGNVTMSRPHETILTLNESAWDLEQDRDENLRMFTYMPDRRADPHPFNESIYKVDPGQEASLIAYLNELFSTGWTSIDSMATKFQGNSSARGTVPAAAERSAKNPNFTHILDNLTISLTEAIRLAEPHCEVRCLDLDFALESQFWELVYGETFSDKMYIQVRWAWLGLPIALIALIALLLGCTILTAPSAGRDKVWKSSGIAALLHQLQGWAPEDLRATKQEDLVQKAKTLRARIVEEDGGFYLVKAKELS